MTNRRHLPVTVDIRKQKAQKQNATRLFIVSRQKTKRCQPAKTIVVLNRLSIGRQIYMRPDDDQLTRAVECALMGHNRRLIDHMAPRERRCDETISRVIRCSAPCRVPRWSERPSCSSCPPGQVPCSQAARAATSVTRPLWCVLVHETHHHSRPSLTE